MTDAQAFSPTPARSSRRAIARRFAQIGMLIVVQAVLLFAAAGSIGWWPGWAYLGLYVFLILVNAVVILPNDRGLIEERGQPKAAMRSWDRTFARVTTVLGPAILVVGGLDARFGWPPAIPLGLQVVGGVVMGLAYLLFSWAMSANRFFSTIVRVQKDRGHTVVSGGPYRFVRHPAYAGTVVIGLATPLLLGSAWALVPGILTGAAVVVRTALEDKTLQRELEGYAEYAQRVRFRLVPGVW